MMQSSKLECEEKATSCEGRPEVFCVECATYQCSACNAALHETSFATPQYSAHKRHDLSKVHICEVRLCKPISTAAVQCMDCCDEPRLCKLCDDLRHRSDGPRSGHNRVPSDKPEWSQGEVAEGGSDEDRPDAAAACSGSAEGPRKGKKAKKAAKASRTKELSKASHAKESPLSSRVDESTTSSRAAAGDGHRSFRLFDASEKLQITSTEELVHMLGCEVTTPVKVVSIVGNTGDGKSYTLNNLFFGGEEVFAVSPEPESCTMGVWVAYDSNTSTVVLDTEGMMGISSNVNQRVRMLLKVLAISDIIIYKTNAGRLHTDMFTFLSDSSHAFQKHFSKELKNAVERSKASFSANTLAPSAIVFHETQRTDLLGDGTSDGKRPRQVHRKTGNQSLITRFAELKLPQPEFSSLHYCGTRTDKGDTDFSGLKELVRTLLVDSSVRTARPVLYMMSALKHLNTKFDGALPDSLDKMFPDEYFTCPTTCPACNCRCEKTMNHELDDDSHFSSARCVYQAKMDNKVYLCRHCIDNSREEIVIPKASSSQTSLWGGLLSNVMYGYVIECSRCGVIFRQREHWYGNKDPSEDAVRVEIRHVWPGDRIVGTGTQNAARRLLEGLSNTAEVVSSVSATPARYMGDWMSDIIAPSYWTPNAKITACKTCDKDLTSDESRHHCRACGKGFCNDCTCNRMSVEWRGWPANTPVRVCDACFQKGHVKTETLSENTAEREQLPSITPRRVGEAVAVAATAVAGAMEYPKAFLKDAARPAYWTADDEISQCCVCGALFGDKLPLHHCRSCGEGVCDKCSQRRRKVADRGWDMAVRVCDACCSD